MNSMTYPSVTRGIVLTGLAVVLGVTVHAGDITIDGSLIVSNTLTVQGSASFETNLSVNGAISAQSLVLSGASRSSWYDKAAGVIYSTDFASDPFTAGSVWTNLVNTTWDGAAGGSIRGAHGVPIDDCGARVYLGYQPYGVYSASFSVSNVYAAGYLRLVRAGAVVGSMSYGAGCVTLTWTSSWDALDFYHAPSTGGPIYWHDLSVSCSVPIGTNSVAASEVAGSHGYFSSLEVEGFASMATLRTTNVVATTESNRLVISTIDRTDAPSQAQSGMSIVMRSANGNNTMYIPAGAGGNVVIACGNGGHSTYSTEGTGGSLVVIPGTNGTDGSGTPGYSYFARRLYIGDPATNLVSYLEYESPTTIVVRASLVPVNSSAFSLGAQNRRWGSAYLENVDISGSATIAHMPAQGDISMGPYTNTP